MIGWVLFIAQLIGFADDSKPDEKEWDNPRGYKIMKPDNLDSEKNYPLIISLHGFTSNGCLLYTSPSPRDGLLSRMPSSA